jgi:riboflavin synthase alpha subunit
MQQLMILVQVGERVNLEADCMGKAACATLTEQ